MTAPALLLLTLAAVSTTGVLEPVADDGNKIISTNDTPTSTRGRVNFVPSIQNLDRKYRRRFSKTDLSGERYTRVKREEDPCASFQFSGVNQMDIWHPHPSDDPNNSNYYREINCVTVINGTEGSVLELTFVDVFDIEDHPECEYDYLEIRDGLRGYAPLLGGKKLCGHKFPQPIVTTGPNAWLKFHSDDTIEKEGFHIKVTAKPAAKSHAVSEQCHIKMGGVEGVLNVKEINSKCKEESTSYGYEVLWTIEARAGHKIYLNFTNFKLAEPNSCEENVVQVFGSVVEFDSKLAHYCGSIADPVTTKADTKKVPNDPGNVMHVRVHTTKASKEDTEFEAHYTVYRTLDATDDTDTCTEDEFDCRDSSCIAKDLICDDYSHCRLKADEDTDLCKGETYSALSDRQIQDILITFSLILSGMVVVFLFKCFWKLYQDQKIIKNREMQACFDGLESLAERRLTLDARNLESPKPRASLERENLTNEIYQKRRSVSQEKVSSDPIIQETHLDLEESAKEETNSVPIEIEDKEEQDGETRQNDTSKREEAFNIEKEVGDKELRDVSVGTLDTKESGCQTRDSLFQTAPISTRSSDGSGRNSRRLSIFRYSGPSMARSSPPRKTSEITIELLRRATPPEPAKTPKSSQIIPDRRPMSNETTRSAPDVIVLAKPI